MFLPFKHKKEQYEIVPFYVSGAGNGSRTRILTLARSHNSRYTIPAYALASADKPAISNTNEKLSFPQYFPVGPAGFGPATKRL